MKRNLIALTVLAVVGGLLVHSASSAFAKDDTDKEAKERAKLVEKYETKKGGKLLTRSPYWIDVKGIDDSRLVVSTSDQGNDGHQFLCTAQIAAATTDLPPELEIVMMRYKQYTQNGNTRSNHTFDFKEADMPKVDPSRLEDLTTASYLSFVKQAKDVVEKDNQKPKKKKVGVADWTAMAIGKENDQEGRVRMEWYTWIEMEWTYVVRAKLASRVIDNESRQELIQTFVKNIKEAK